jgi:high-affinity Fe2+/Pb2+ permease
MHSITYQAAHSSALALVVLVGASLLFLVASFVFRPRLARITAFAAVLTLGAIVFIASGQAVDNSFLILENRGVFIAGPGATQ